MADSRKQSIYLPEDVLVELKTEAARTDPLDLLAGAAGLARREGADRRVADGADSPRPVIRSSDSAPHLTGQNPKASSTMRTVAKFTGLALASLLVALTGAAAHSFSAGHHETIPVTEAAVVAPPAKVVNQAVNEIVPASAADVQRVTEALDRLRAAQTTDFRQLDNRVSRIEGYMEAEAERKHGSR